MSNFGYGSGAGAGGSGASATEKAQMMDQVKSQIAVAAAQELVQVCMHAITDSYDVYNIYYTLCF